MSSGTTPGALEQRRRRGRNWCADCTGQIWHPVDLLALCERVGGDRAIAAASLTEYYNLNAIGQLRDRNALGALECLAQSAWRGVNVEAMNAIRGIAAPESVPRLIERLDDKNAEVQYLSVITLFHIVRRPGDVGPSVPMFEQDKDRFIRSWKQWWADVGHFKYSEPKK